VTRCGGRIGRGAESAASWRTPAAVPAVPRYRGAMADDEVPLPPAEEPAPFTRGATVAIRSVRDHGPRHGVAVGFAVAGTVVRDRDDVVVVATAPGSDVRVRAGRGDGPNGRTVLPAAWDGTYEERVWQGATVVRVHRRGDRWSVWRWHDGERWGDVWYGNLESPWRRSALGFESQDWALDVVGRGDPTGDAWRVGLKDEDELAWMVQRGYVTEQQAAHVHDVGAHLLQRAREARWPFDADWDAWLPEPAWGAVALPPGWDRLPTGRREAEPRA